MIAIIWAEGPLDVLMNNAAGNFLARTEELSLGAFQSVIGIVLMGTLHTTMACGRRWLAAGRGGVVLNVTTTYTTTGSAYVVPSAVAKAGVQALTRSLAVEWGNRGIRMNAIAPGPIPTEGAFSRLLPRPELAEAAKKRIPLGRFGTMEEFANLAAFLVSDGSGYINGEVVTMDGGEWLQGAGEFTALGRELTEKEWETMRPKPRSPEDALETGLAASAAPKADQRATRQKHSGERFESAAKNESARTRLESSDARLNSPPPKSAQHYSTF